MNDSVVFSVAKLKFLFFSFQVGLFSFLIIILITGTVYVTYISFVWFHANSIP